MLCTLIHIHHPQTNPKATSIAKGTLATAMHATTHSRQALIDNRLLKENAKQISHDYQTGEPVLKKSILSFSDKLQPMFTGPYIIE